MVCLSAGARKSHQVGLSMAVAVDKEELRTGERGVEPCPIRYCVSVRRQEGESSWAFCGRWFWTRSSEKESLRVGHGTTTEEWRVQLAAIGGASHHEWAMGDGVVDGKLGVEWGLIQTLAVWTPGPSWCVIASYRRQGLQLAQVREYQQMNGRVEPELVAV